MIERLDDLLERRLRAARERTPLSALARDAWIVADDRLQVRWERVHGVRQADFEASHRYVRARDALFGRAGADRTTWSSTPHPVRRVSSLALARAGHSNEHTGPERARPR